jgi:trimethylamine:corrinoid methyltransferase-like protein
MAKMDKKFFANSVMVIMLLGLATFVHYCKNVKTESDYYNPEVLATHDNGEHFVGSETCKECHTDIYKTHLKTAHYNTGAMADSTNIKGSFKLGSNILDLKDVEFIMSAVGDDFYQHTRIKNRSTVISPSKFDIVIGSGVRGQSYLTWENDDLYQLQASYYTLDIPRKVYHHSALKFTSKFLA